MKSSSSSSLYYIYNCKAIFWCPFINYLSFWDLLLGPTMKMRRNTRWSDKEVVILLYFSSRSIWPKSIRQLLLHRGYNRSISAIQAKIACILRQTPNLKRPSGLWDLEIVDYWVDNHLGGNKMVNELIDFMADDAEEVALVSCI